LLKVLVLLVLVMGPYWIGPIGMGVDALRRRWTKEA